MRSLSSICLRLRVKCYEIIEKTHFYFSELHNINLEKWSLRKSRFVSLVAVFAAINIAFDSLGGLSELSSGVWYSWIFIMEPINGIVLGPYAGFLSNFIGVMIGHCIYFRNPYEFLFTFGAPTGAMVSGLLFRGELKTVSTYYTMLLAAYFITPIAWQLPVWGMWNVYLAYAILLVMAVVLRKKLWKLKSKRLLATIAICAFVGLEADVLFRIFVLVPCQTYRIFWQDVGVDTLRSWWIMGAAVTPIKVAISTLVTTLIGPPLIKIIKKIGFSPMA